MRVEPKTIDIVVATHNYYATSSTPFTWQTDRFINLFQLRRVRVSGVGTTSVGVDSESNCLYLQRRDAFRKQLFVPPE